MRSRILAAVAAEEEHGGHTAAVVGITFALTAMLILILAKSHHNNLPVSP
jgi:hypothetical protein